MKTMKFSLEFFSRYFENRICSLSFGNPLDGKIIKMQQRLAGGQMIMPIVLMTSVQDINVKCCAAPQSVQK